MATLDFNRVLRITLVSLSVALVAGLATALWHRAKTEHLTVAAGASSGESYILGNALKTVVERHYPKIRMTLLETGGTVENLRMLEDWARPASYRTIRHLARPQGSSCGGVI
jgi:TRAP-type uncharacterized transport system substrate-binding protein